MNEIISSILDAENKADNIIKEANEKARNLVLSADAESEKIKANAIDSFKNKRKQTLIKAEKTASEKYYKMVEAGVKEASNIKESSADKVDTAVETLVKEILA